MRLLDVLLLLAWLGLMLLAAWYDNLWAASYAIVGCATALAVSGLVELVGDLMRQRYDLLRELSAIRRDLHRGLDDGK